MRTPPIRPDREPPGSAGQGHFSRAVGQPEDPPVQPIGIGAECVVPDEPLARRRPQGEHPLAQFVFARVGVQHPGHVVEHDTVEIQVVLRFGHSGEYVRGRVDREIGRAKEDDLGTQQARLARKSGEKDEIQVAARKGFVGDGAPNGSAQPPGSRFARVDAKQLADRLREVLRGPLGTRRW